MSDNNKAQEDVRKKGGEPRRRATFLYAVSCMRSAFSFW